MDAEEARLRKKVADAAERNRYIRTQTNDPVQHAKARQAVRAAAAEQIAYTQKSKKKK